MTVYGKPYRIKKRKSILKNRFFWLGIAFFIIAGGIFYLVSFSSFLQIKRIEISGNVKIQSSDLENYIGNKILKEIIFIPTKSILLVDLDDMEKNISQDFPEIFTVIVKRNFPSILRVEIEEKFPVAVFLYGEKYFLLDKGGMVFQEAFTMSDYLVITSQTLLPEIKLGQKVIEDGIFSQILDIKSKIEDNLKILLESANIVSKQRLNIKTVEGWKIYFNPEKDIDWQITELKTVLENKILPEKRKNVDYIDLRFQKIYIYPDTYNK